MYLILCTKVFVVDDSFTTSPEGETSLMHCSAVILSSNLEGFVGLFYELWPLVLIFYWIEVRWSSGRSSSFILFLWNQSRVCWAVFGIIFIILVLKQLILISTDEGQDCFLITDSFCWCLGFPWLFAPHVFNTFSLCHCILLHIT